MNLINLALDLFFPKTCGICEKICEDTICSVCRKKLEKIIFPNRKCFLEKAGIYYDEHMHVFKYDGIIKEKIRQYKFKDQAYLCEFFAEIIYSNEKVMKYVKSYEYIVPIPLNKYRNRERGYNQTYLILKELYKKDKSIIIKNNILQKQKNIKPQSSLNKLESKNNIKNAYCVVNQNNIIDKKIVLFDDVFTTGSTTNECSRILKEYGAKKVGILTITKD